MRRELAPKRIDLRDIIFRFFKFSARLLLLEFVYLEPERIFKHCAALARVRKQYPIRLALGDDMVPGLADVRTREELVHVAEPDARAVNRVLARPIAEDRPLKRNFVKINLKNAAGVIEDDRDRRAIRPRSRMRAAPDEVLGALPAHALHRLLAERETECFRHVRFS